MATPWVRVGLLTGVGLHCPRLEFKGDKALVADHPGVMTRLDHIGLSRPKVDLGAILVRYAQCPGLNHADMPRLAALCASHGLDTLRPPPARLEREPTDGCGTAVDHVDPRLIGSPRLVRRVEVQGLHASHTNPLPVADLPPRRTLTSCASRVQLRSADAGRMLATNQGGAARCERRPRGPRSLNSRSESHATRLIGGARPLRSGLPEPPTKRRNRR